jgi:hypothetical protein
MHGAVVPVLGGRAERGDAPGVGVLEVGVPLYEQLNDVVIGVLGSKPERASAALSKFWKVNDFVYLLYVKSHSVEE